MKVDTNRIGSYCIKCYEELSQYPAHNKWYWYCPNGKCSRFGLVTLECQDREFIQKYVHKKENMKNGFTLVELLVVIAIMGILIAIALAVFLSKSPIAEPSCEIYGNFTVNEIPVRCLKHFNIERIK